MNQYLISILLGVFTMMYANNEALAQKQIKIGTYTFSLSEEADFFFESVEDNQRIEMYHRLEKGNLTTYTLIYVGEEDEYNGTFKKENLAMITEISVALKALDTKNTKQPMSIQQDKLQGKTCFFLGTLIKSGQHATAKRYMLTSRLDQTVEILEEKDTNPVILHFGQKAQAEKVMQQIKNKS